MALRIRKNRKKILCAAESKPQKGDCYLNDDIHYILAVEMKVLHTNDKGETGYFKSSPSQVRKGVKLWKKEVI